MNLELLKELYLTYSPSHYEVNVLKIIERELKKLKIPYQTDKTGQIYRFTDQPLVCAHTDQVSYKPIRKLHINGDKISANGNLGADDKNGIWIILHVLKDNPHLSFIFSTAEESGGDIADLLFNHQSELERIPYGLVFDRRGKSDIIGTDNHYCNDDFEVAVATIGKPFGYKPAIGIFSDCNAISDYIPCVNLSCGYYQAHTAKEYTKVSELKNALNFGLSIVSTLFDGFTKPEKPKYKYSYSYDYSYSDEWLLYCETCDKYFEDDESTAYLYDCPICGDYLCEVEKEPTNETEQPKCDVCGYTIAREYMTSLGGLDICDYCYSNLPEKTERATCSRCGVSTDKRYLSTVSGYYVCDWCNETKTIDV